MNNSFANNRIVNITIPDSVVSINGGAFKNNRLTSITLPENVHSIGKYTFANNQLTSVVLPENVTSVADYAFTDNDIASITIEYDGGVAQTQMGNHFISDIAFNWSKANYLYLNVTHIGQSFFSSASQFETFSGQLVLGNGVTEIGRYAFNDTQLTSVIIGNGITSIGDGAFYKDSSHNSNLASITIDKPCSVIKSMNHYPWIESNNRAGTTIYGSNNEVCDAW